MQNYRSIWKKHFGEIPKDENGQTYEIHHIDRNRNNNSIDNLMCVSKDEHIEIHFKAKEYAAAYAILKRKKGVSKKDFTGWKHSEETKNKISSSLIGNKNPMFGKKREDRKGKGFWLGKKQPNEMIEKRRISQLGQKRPKQSISMKGVMAGAKNPMFGIKGDKNSRSREIKDLRCDTIFCSIASYCEIKKCTKQGVYYHIKKGNIVYV
jgi:hypothetical protein